MIVKRRTRGTNGIRPARLAEVSFSTTLRSNATTIPVPNLHYYHLGLHYSQTPTRRREKAGGVLLPLGITLLSNSPYRAREALCVLLPLGITLLSNPPATLNRPLVVLLPLGITLLSNKPVGRLRPMAVLLPLGIILLSNAHAQA